MAKEQILDLADKYRHEFIKTLELDENAVFAYPRTAELEDFPRINSSIVEELSRGIGLERLARTFDHTVLKPEAAPADIENLCEEALKYNFYSVCVNGLYVPLAKKLLAASNVHVAAVVGFPLGAMSSGVKAAEAAQAVYDGADEIDMVIPVGLLKSGKISEVYEDIRAVVTVSEVPVKVIIETCLLSDEEKIKVCLLAVLAGAAFVKTSTGFSSGGATEEDIALMRTVVGDACGVKASGGVRSLEAVLKMIMAGANRIGTSSGAKILSEK